jgi:multiple sugar transport system substrate-binding protein
MPVLTLRSRRLAASALAVAGLVVAGCGSESSGGPATLNLWVFQEPSGSFTDAAQRCSEQSRGRYRIVSTRCRTPPISSGRRSCGCSRRSPRASISRGWTWCGRRSSRTRAGSSRGRSASPGESGAARSPGPLRTATWQGRLWAAPANTNTQLLWYRKDLVRDPARTWDGLITQASRLAKAGRIEIQGAQYEGAVVWFNSLVRAAGGTIIESNQVTLGKAGLTAARIMKRLATSPAADPSLIAQMEDQNRLAFEQGEAAFEVNYPFVYPSAREDVPEIFKEMAWRPYPEVEPGRPAKAPIGGINWGVGAYTKHPAEAFEAAACLRNAQNQREAAVKGGLPPTLSRLYDDKTLRKAYPFADLIRLQVENGAVRPQTPAYEDVSLAIATTVSPPSNIQLNGFVENLRGKLQDALESKGLF